MEKKRIMVVEDEGIIAKDIQMSLQHLGYEVPSVVPSGEEAIKKAEEHRPDLVLMDIVLQGEIDGIEAANHIHSHFDIPIIYLTAYADEETLNRAKITEPFGYILKPFEERELQTNIEMAIYKHKMEKKLRESEEWLATILRSIGDAVIATDANGYVKFMNPVAESLIGWKMEEAMGKPLKEVYNIVSEETGKRIKNPVEKVIREGLVVGLANHTVLVAKDGRKVPIDDSGAPIRDEKENIIGVALIFRDITEKKKAEKKIREARDFLQNIIESSMDGIVVCDAKGHVISANSALETMSGFSREEMMGKHVTIIFPADEQEYRQNAVERIAELLKKGSTSYQAVFKPEKGKSIHIECNISMIKNSEGNYAAGVAIIRDISERKKMEQQLVQSEKLKSLGELAGGVAHDFNNVLAAILGRAQLLKMGIEAPRGEQERRKSIIELKRGLEVIEKAAKDGAETVRRIQEFARRRDDDRYFTTIDLNEIIESALEFTKMKWKDDAESKAIKINIQKELSPTPFISGSAAELREVFTNLINNAIDAIPQGGKIKIKTFKEDSNISIKVEDTGIGIPEAIRNKIFDPFFTTKGPQSTGLGMSVSYGIINRHRGTITVDSVEGKGTTFTIKLPISEEVIKEEQVKPMPEEQRKAKILVIEDEEDVRDILSAILINGGHEVETASDGGQGIEIFEKKEFDLVFTDLGMPGMSGWQVAEKVKGINRRIPVALITGWNVELNESEMRKSGVDLIVYKPFEVNQVLRLVQEGMVIRDRFKAA